MTREEAAKILEKQFDESCGDYRYQNKDKLDYEDALWLAIAALRALDAQENLKPFGEWVSVKDKMPEPFVSVLGYMPDAAPFPEARECYCTGDSDKKFFVPALSERHEISHWAELPEPPKEGR